MAQQKRQCTNCGRINDAEANFCAICGTPLTGRRATAQSQTNISAPNQPSMTYDPMDGEDDLMINGVLSTPFATAIVSVLCLALVAGLSFFAISMMDEEPEQGAMQNTQTSEQANMETPMAGVSPTNTATVEAFPTNTRPAPPLLPTVTPLPPTFTFTPTEGPCIQTAGAGDTLYALALRCGHRDLSIIPVIVEQNIGLESAESLREGQTIEIPKPTAEFQESDPALSTPDANSSSNTGNSASDTTVSNNEFGTPDAIATFFIEPTLPTGLAWHTIEENQNLIIVAQIYDTDAKALSDINPEIEFRQCDFSMRYGGENCSVIFGVGQRVRVPALPPTATIPPTPSGSETATPTLTATFNVPRLFGPEDGQTFGSSALITLRWTATGTLAQNEVYLVTVVNQDSERTFQDTTVDLFFVVPDDWQPSSDSTQTFEWSVSIATIEGDRVTSTRQQTDTREFIWRGR